MPEIPYLFKTAVIARRIGDIAFLQNADERGSRRIFCKRNFQTVFVYIKIDGGNLRFDMRFFPFFIISLLRKALRRSQP